MLIWIQKYLKGDKYIWGIIITLIIVSSVIVYSASSSLVYRFASKTTMSFLLKHVALCLITLIFTWIVHLIPQRLFFRYAFAGLTVSLFLLCVTLLFGNTYNQATRWLNLPLLNYTFQPSDLAKVGLIVGLAKMLASRQKRRLSFTPILLWCGATCGLITWSDWSSGAMLFSICLILLYIARTPLNNMLLMLVLGVLLGLASFNFGQRGATVSSRWEQYWSDSTVPYQTQQSYIAIVSGGFWGRGSGKSIQKNLLPNSYSDFTFAIIVEEYGWFGCISVLAIYFFFMFRILTVSKSIETYFGQLLIIGLGILITLQALLHICVNVGLIPITGLTLPFLSMGGSSLIVMGIAVGLILSASTKAAPKSK